MKVKTHYLFFLSAFFSLVSFADCADCEAYKTQVVNDCDSIVSSCNVALSDIDSAHGSISTAISIADNQTQISQLNSALTSVSALRGTLETLSTFALSIKSTAQALQCSTNNTTGTCECAEYLSSISTNVASLKTNIDTIVIDISTIADSLGTEPETISKYLHYISDDSINILEILSQFFEYENGSQDVPFTISDYASIQTNLLTSIYSALTSRVVRATNMMTKPIYNFMISDGRIYRSSLSGETPGPNGDKYVTAIYPYISSTPGKLKDLSLLEAVYGGFWTTFYNLSSLNNYAYTNFFLFSSINDKLTDISQGVSEITNQFSIFIQASAGASPVLSAYTSQDGTYHDYLTNYYIQVSGSSVSGSTPLTNWFNRIEMLLAALVFQDEDGPNTNSVPSSSSYDQVEDSLNQTFTSINQQGQDFISTVDTSGKSILLMLSEWNSAVSGVAKPSAFTIAEIPNSFSSGEPVRRDGSSNDLKLTLDTDNELFSGFVELVRGVTTLSWITLFLVVGYFLSIRIITLIGKLISFGYSVYSAIFGGG